MTMIVDNHIFHWINKIIVQMKLECMHDTLTLELPIARWYHQYTRVMKGNSSSVTKDKKYTCCITRFLRANYQPCTSGRLV
jgi:hypothetical protein